MGVVESVPKPRKRDGNPPYLRVVTLHAQMALFPEKRFRHSRKIPAYFAPILLRISSEVKQVNIRNNTTNNITNNNNTRVPKPLRKQVWLKRNGNVIEGKCYVCIGAISYDTFESGHVKAASTGGETTLQNLEPICKTCNNDMGIEDLEQFKKVWYQQHDQYKSSGVQGH